MSYRLDIRVKPLFSVDVIVETPSPEDVESPSFNTPTGNAVYVPEHNALKWTIKQFAGHK